MIKDLFKNAKVKYAYDKKQKIYSVLVMLDNRPRILTVRTGENFTELSLADKNGTVLEVLRQEEGQGVTVHKMVK